MNKIYKIALGLGLVFASMIVVGLMSPTAPSDTLGSVTDNRFTQIPSNTSFTCGPTSNIVVSTSSSRLYLALVNDGTSTVYLGLGSTATTSKGIRLNASGGSLEMDTTSLFTGSVYCVSAASSTLTVTESTQ